jgi:ABC-type multidrug transport system fused ATPase/permease subunit
VEEEQFDRHYPLRHLVRDLGPFVRPHRCRFLAASVLQFTSQLAWLYPPYALAEIVSFFGRYKAGDSLEPLLIIAIIWTFLSVYRYISAEGGNYIGYQLAEKIGNDAMEQSFRHLLTLDLAWHERENAGNKVKRIQKGRDALDRLLRIWFDLIIDSAVNFAGMTIVVAMIDRRIAFGMVLFLITYAALGFPLTTRAGNQVRRVNAVEEEISGLCFEVIGNIRSVRVLGMAQGLSAIARGRFAYWFESIRCRIRAFRVREAVLNLWSQAFRLGLTLWILWGVVKGRYDVGFLILFYNYFNYVWESIRTLSSTALDIVVSKYGFLRMKELLEVKPGIDADEGKQQFPKDWHAIHLRKLSFSYGAKPVLSNLDLTIRRGERIGIVGVSGAGKSTLFKLLLKEREEYSGDILVNAVPLRDVQRSSFFRFASVVLQDTEVFNMSLRDNIVLANSDKAEDEELLRQSIEIAHISDFLPKLPQGIETIIGEKGFRLSGGERQRLGIARAIFKQPQILLLDEATSHLDLESEAKIRDSLHTFFQSVTAIVIAHRLTTIREMDRILVLEQGVIIEDGGFDELIAKRGRFAELWARQKF